MSDEFEIEPVPGLPEKLPAGERILWQGSPSKTSLARHALHADAVALYFVALAVARLAWAASSGEPIAGALPSAAAVLFAGAISTALLVTAARLSARTTLYTITNKRLVMRYGIAMPMSVNIPFSQVRSAAVNSYGDKTGDIALDIAGPMRLAYLHLWPHARAWHLKEAQPALRSLPDAKAAAEILVKAVAAAGVPAAVQGLVQAPSLVKTSAPAAARDLATIAA